MRFLAVLTVVLAGCSCRVQSTPALPADPPRVAEPAPPRPACEFPPEPAPPSIVGWPTELELLTTRSDALELRRYLIAGAEWRRAVEKCIGGAP